MLLPSSAFGVARYRCPQHHLISSLKRNSGTTLEKAKVLTGWYPFQHVFYHITTILALMWLFQINNTFFFAVKWPMDKTKLFLGVLKTQELCVLKSLWVGRLCKYICYITYHIDHPPYPRLCQGLGSGCWVIVWAGVCWKHPFQTLYFHAVS